MKFEVFGSYQQMSEAGAALLAETVRVKPDAVLGLATGATPEGVYSSLISLYQAGKLDFSNVKTINLDEYFPISQDDPQSYRQYMNTHLFKAVNLRRENTHLPDGSARDAWAEANRYEALCASLGYADVQLLGVGRNGHIGFNEPESLLYPETHLTALTPSTIAANSKYFTGRDMPHEALTMGMGTILRSRKIVLLASGKEKHPAIRALLAGKVTTAVPVTFLLLHPDVTVLCDEDARNG